MTHDASGVSRLAGIAADRAGLERLLALWRDVPDAQLAAAIDAVGACVARGVHSPVGVDDEDRERAWKRAAEEGDPVLRQRLVESVFEVWDCDAKLARAAALAKYRDPRVTSVLLELVRGGHCLRAHRVNDFWKPLFA